MGMKWLNETVEGVECFCLSQMGFFLLTIKETKPSFLASSLIPIYNIKLLIIASLKFLF